MDNSEARGPSSDPEDQPRSLAPRVERINSLLASPSALLPRCPHLLSTVLGEPGAAAAIDAEIAELICAGRLRQVVVRTELHIARPKDGPRVSTAAKAEDMASGERETLAFQRKVKADVERERLLLYRVFFVLLLIGGFVLVRQLILFFLRLS